MTSFWAVGSRIRIQEIPFLIPRPAVWTPWTTRLTGSHGSSAVDGSGSIGAIGVVAAVGRQGDDRTVGRRTYRLTARPAPRPCRRSSPLNCTFRFTALQHLLSEGAGLAGHVGHGRHGVLVAWRCTGRSSSPQARRCRPPGTGRRWLPLLGPMSLCLRPRLVEGDLCAGPSIVEAGLHRDGAGGVVGWGLARCRGRARLSLMMLPTTGATTSTGVVLDPTRVVQQNEDLDLRVVDWATRRQSSSSYNSRRHRDRWRSVRSAVPDLPPMR